MPKKSSFENFESTLYSTSVSMPLKKTHFVYNCGSCLAYKIPIISQIWAFIHMDNYNTKPPPWSQITGQIRKWPKYLWHDQGKWVTCRQFSIFSFQYKSLVHVKCYILIQIPFQSDTWFQRYGQLFNFKNNVKHKNLSPVLAYNSKSIFRTSDSLLLIMSHLAKIEVYFILLTKLGWPI